MADLNRGAYEQTETTVLERLVHPLDVREFMEAYWQKHTIYIEGPNSKFDWLFDAAVVLTLLDDRHLDFVVVEEDEHGVVKRNPLNTAEAGRERNARDLYDGGRDIHIMNFHETRALWSEVLSDIRGELGHLGNVSTVAICTQNKDPIDFHFDGRGVLNIQLLGKKRWTSALDVAVSWPERYAHEKASKEMVESLDAAWQQEILAKRPRGDGDTFSFTMTPGDITYVPAGIWHAVPEVVETPSVSALITFDSMPTADIVSPKLKRELLRQQVHRNGPLRPWNDDAYVDQVIADLRCWTGALTPQAVRELLITKMTEGTRPVAPHARTSAEPSFRHAYTGPVYLQWTNEERTTCALHQGPHEIVFDEPPQVAFAQGIMHHKSFTLPEAVGWTGREHAAMVEENLAALVGVGFLVRSE